VCNSNGVYEKLPYFQGKNNPENHTKIDRIQYPVKQIT
jgi:hypothetical protein